jgi:prepilin-type N-terminal cleavage/methylation domain-containing protein
MVFKSKNHQEGFTLIEVLISITLLSLLMTYVYNIINNSVNMNDTITIEDKELLGVERAFDRIGTDFSQIYSPLYFSPQKKDYSSDASSSIEDYNEKVNEFEISEKFPLLSHNGLPVPHFESPDKSSFIFLSTANRRRLENTREARFVWIKYKLMTDEKSRSGSALVRNYVPYQIYSPDDYFSKSSNQIILRNVKSLEFEYWDPAKKKWASGLTELNDAKFSIALIRVTLEWLDLNKNIHEYVRTFRNFWQTYNPYLDELIYKEEQEAIEKVEKQKNRGKK